MNKTSHFKFITLLFFAMACAAAEPRAARIVRFSTLNSLPPDSPQRLEIARVQVFLDRAMFRPGKIDALGGEFTQKAADRYCIANQMPAGQRIDASSISQPYREYVVAEEDLAWIGPLAATPPEQEKQKRMPYASPWEALAERFHADVDFIQELNPSVKEPKPGDVIRVPDVVDFRIADVQALERKRRDEEKARKAARDAAANGNPAPVQPGSIEASSTPESSPAASPQASPAGPEHHLVLNREQRLIEVYEHDHMIACFPCTPGSSSIPVPTGLWKITSNVLMPHFRWDESVLETGVRSETAYNIPPGPNNPVGIVWMGINRPSVGMHGTTSPDQIGRNQSHGCIRLANWDAFALCQIVEKGTPVEVK